MPLFNLVNSYEHQIDNILFYIPIHTILIVLTDLWKSTHVDGYLFKSIASFFKYAS